MGRHPAGRNDRNQKRADKQNALMTALAVTAVLAVISAIVWNAVSKSDFLKYAKKAFQAGEETYTVAEVNYYYFSAYYGLLESMNGYEQLAGLDRNQELSEQECPLAKTRMSWRDYILEQAEKRLSEVSIGYQDALGQGYEADAAIQSSVANAVEYQKMMASDNGYEDLDSYLRTEYGGMNEELLKRLLEQEFIARTCEQKRMLACEFSDEEMREYYEEHLYEYNKYSYLYAYVGTDAELADEIMNAEGEQDFRETVKELLGTDCYEILDTPGSELGDGESEDLRWISDTRRERGDTYLGQSGADWYVLCFLASDDNGFSGDGDEWRPGASAGLKDEWLAEWKEELAEQYGFSEKPGIRYVGMQM